MEDAPPLAPPVDPEPEVPTFPPRKALREFQSLLDELTITAVRMKAILDREEADDVLDEEMDRLTAQADGLRTQLAAALPALVQSVVCNAEELEEEVTAVTGPTRMISMLKIINEAVAGLRLGPTVLARCWTYTDYQQYQTWPMRVWFMLCCGWYTLGCYGWFLGRPAYSLGLQRQYACVPLRVPGALLLARFARYVGISVPAWPLIAIVSVIAAIYMDSTIFHSIQKDDLPLIAGDAAVLTAANSAAVPGMPRLEGLLYEWAAVSKAALLRLEALNETLVDFQLLGAKPLPPRPRAAGSVQAAQRQRDLEAPPLEERVLEAPAAEEPDLEAPAVEEREMEAPAAAAAAAAVQ